MFTSCLRSLRSSARAGVEPATSRSLVQRFTRSVTASPLLSSICNKSKQKTSRNSNYCLQFSPLVAFRNKKLCHLYQTRANKQHFYKDTFNDGYAFSSAAAVAKAKMMPATVGSKTVWQTDGRTVEENYDRNGVRLSTRAKTELTFWILNKSVSTFFGLWASSMIGFRLVSVERASTAQLCSNARKS